MFGIQRLSIHQSLAWVSGAPAATRGAASARKSNAKYIAHGEKYPHCASTRSTASPQSERLRSAAIAALDSDQLLPSAYCITTASGTLDNASSPTASMNCLCA